MKQSGLNAAIRGVQTLYEEGTIGGLTDGQLLERFLARREDAVFEAIVQRHGPMVWGVCRRVLRDLHDAEDAFQATFLVLARKGATVVPREKVGPWLYGVAYQTARKARATRSRRRVREGRLPEGCEPAAGGENPRNDLLHELDRELSRLPEKYRVPIVLCDLERKSHGEAAAELGCPLGTVSGRLSKGRAMLAGRLARAGSALSAGSLATLLAEQSGAAPGTDALARAAVRFAVGRTLSVEGVSAEVATLTSEVLSSMWIGKLKLVAVLFLLSVSMVAGGTTLVLRAKAFADPGGTVPAAPESPRSAPPRIALAQAPAIDSMAAYPFRLAAEKVVELPELSIRTGDLHLKTGPVTVVPMSTERGMAGAMLIGGGTFRYTPEPGTTIEGPFRAGMLRFNPEEQPALLPLDKGATVRDQGAAEMSRQILQKLVGHCWHRGQDLLMLPRGSFAAVLYSRDHGDLLISFDARTKVAYSFTDRKPLYEKK